MKFAAYIAWILSSVKTINLVFKNQLQYYCGDIEFSQGTVLLAHPVGSNNAY